MWTEVDLSHVHLSFLRAEWHKIPVANKDEFRQLLDAPHLSDRAENDLRIQLLNSLRKPLLQRIPGDTRWYEVRHLQESHLIELRVIGRCGWDDGADQNELDKVAKRKHNHLKENPLSWEAPILWGHNKSGPFTILEGNNRLTAYAAARHRPPMNIPIYIGLSDKPCFWHLSDPFLKPF